MNNSRHQDYLDQLPGDWDKVSIEDLGEIFAGGTPSRDQPSFWNGSILWVTPGELTSFNGTTIFQSRECITRAGLNGSSAKLMPGGSILVTTRATIGNVAIAGMDLCTNQGFKSIVPYAGVNSEFYCYLLRFITAEMNRLASGSTFDEISLKDFSRIVIPRPIIDEQAVIAGLIDMVDYAIQKTELLIDKLQKMKSGLLNDLLTRGLDENGELRDPEAHPEQFKESSLGRIPREWEVVRLTDHISFPQSQVNPTISQYRSWPLIAPDHIESNTGRLIKIESAEKQGAISGKYPFQKGDVLYCKIRPYLRKATIATFEGLCSADMYPLRPLDTLTSTYLLMIILSEPFSRFAESVSMRSGFPKINRSEMAEYWMPLPRVDEQERINKIISTIAIRLNGEETALNKLKLLKDGLMHDLLTGQVRVPLDDEKGLAITE